MKERKPRRKKKSKLPLLITTAAIVLIIIIGVSLYLQTSKPKEYKDSNEYFTVTGVSALVTSKSDNQTIFIRILVFNLTAVGGDAHNVYIKPPGSIALENYPYNSTVWKDQPWEVSIQYPVDNPLMWDRDPQEDYFKIEVGIVSEETGSEGKIKLILTDDNILIP